MKHTAQQVAFETALTPDLQYTNVTTIRNKVYARARKNDGSPVYVEQKYLPYHYIPVADEAQATHRGYDGTPLISHMSTSLLEARDWIGQSRVPVYGDIQAEYMLLADSYGEKDVHFDVDRLYIWNIDIEVDSEHGFAKPDDPFAEVTAITVKWRHMGKSGVVVYGRKPYQVKGDELYIHNNTEEELLLRFLDDMKGGGDYPDIITGWNVQFYDIPYLVNRMKTLFTEDVWAHISPFERMSSATSSSCIARRTVVDIRGIAILDYLELYRKFTYSQQESYRLDHIAHVELGERKLSFAEYKNLRTLYREDHQKFIEYNIQDVELVDKLDQKLKLIELVCALAYGAKSNFADCSKQVRLWDIMIYHKLRNDGLQIPPRKDVRKNSQYAGAYVKDPIPGFYKWVVSFDVASMYPHIIRQWNLSPEMRYEQMVDRLRTTGKTTEQITETVEYLLARKHDTSDVHQAGVAVAANGLLTDRDEEGFLPNMMKTLYDERIKLQEDAEGRRRSCRNEARPGNPRATGQEHLCLRESAEGPQGQSELGVRRDGQQLLPLLRHRHRRSRHGDRTSRDSLDRQRHQHVT
jgi:DNA polymerase elongation subunit (family B)